MTTQRMVEAVDFECENTHAGDKDRLAAAIGPMMNGLLTHARWLTRSDADAWDLVQGTIERGLRTYRPSVPVERIRGWLLVIMQNLFRDECRSAGVRRRARAALSLGPRHYFDPVELDADENTEPNWVSVEAADLHRCIQRLSPATRSTMTMYANGATYLQMSKELGIALKTVGSRIHRAKRRLRELLAAERASQLRPPSR